MAHDEDIKTARVVLDLLVPEATKAEAVLTKIAASLTDEGLALALTSQAKGLKLAAEEAQKLITLLGTRA